MQLLDTDGSKKMVNLAPMECFTSCLLTSLNISGENYFNLILEYWNIQYRFRTILGSKESSFMSLEVYSGTQATFISSDWKELQDTLLRGSHIILIGSAAKLNYFPRSLLGMENTGFHHCILITAWNVETQDYTVLDPMVDFYGTLTKEEMIIYASKNLRKQTIYFYSISNCREPQMTDVAPLALFRLCTQRNLELMEYSKPKDPNQYFSDRIIGLEAFDAFSHDVIDCRNWDPSKRSQWIQRNALMISFLSKVRLKVWVAYVRLDIMSSNQLDHGRQIIDDILKQWNSIALHLIKLDRLIDVRLIEKIVQKIQKVKETEQFFLKWMCGLGREYEKRF